MRTTLKVAIYRLGSAHDEPPEGCSHRSAEFAVKLASDGSI
jgi:hypothetical protein